MKNLKSKKFHTYEPTQEIVLDNPKQWHYACIKCGKGEKNYRHYRPRFAMMFNWLFNERVEFADIYNTKFILRGKIQNNPITIGERGKEE